MITQYVFLAACLVLFVVPLWFVWHAVYNDGVVGRAGLLGISFGAAGFIAEAACGARFHMPPLAVWLVTWFAVFLVWHLFRFHSRVVSKHGKAPCGRENEIGCPYKVEPPQQERRVA